MNKFINFVKENKIIVLAFIVMVLSFGLLAIPGQFAHFDITAMKPNKFRYNLSGYDFIFGTTKNALGNKLFEKQIVPQAMAAFVMMALSLVGVLFSKKSSFVSMLTGLVMVVVSILLFSISGAGAKVYKGIAFEAAKNGEYYCYLWVPYVIGGLMLIAGGLMLFRTVKVMKEEIKRPQQKGPSYSYLHK